MNTISPYYRYTSGRIAMGNDTDAKRLSRITISDGRPSGHRVRVTSTGQLQWCSSHRGGVNLHGYVSREWAESVTNNKY